MLCDNRKSDHKCCVIISRLITMMCGNLKSNLCCVILLSVITSVTTPRLITMVCDYLKTYNLKSINNSAVCGNLKSGQKTV